MDVKETIKNVNGSEKTSPYDKSMMHQHGPSPTGPGLPRDLEDERLKTLEKLHIEPGESTIMDKAIIPRGTMLTGDQNYEVLTNVFGVRTKSAVIYQYHIEFFKIFEKGVSADQRLPLFMDSIFIRGKSSDYFAHEKREIHRVLMNMFIEKFPDIFGSDPNVFCYDFAKTLFSLNDFKCPDDPLEIPLAEIKASIGRNYRVQLYVKPPPENAFDIRDFASSYGNDLSEFNSTITRFLELATSRFAGQHPDEHLMYENSNTFYLNPRYHGFNRASCADLNNGKYLNPGASKTVVCIEGPKAKNGVPAVIIDSKKTPFYPSMNAVKWCCQILGYADPPNILSGFELNYLQPYFRKLVVHPIHLEKVIPITIAKLSGMNSSEENFVDANGVEYTVRDYFKQKYGRELEYPSWPLALRKIGGKRLLYPLELLLVADNQRCHGNITPEDIAAIVKVCAIPPVQKLQEISNCHKSFCFSNDVFSQNANIEVLNDPFKVPSRILAPPEIQYANGALNPQMAKWRLPKQAKFVKSSSCIKWFAMLVQYSNDYAEEGNVWEFVQKYLSECRVRGLQIYDPINVCKVNGDISSDVEQTFTRAKEESVEFVLILHPEREKALHSMIKAYERKYSIITQCITTKTMFNCMEKSPMSLENIVAKTNMKLGGLNYNINLSNYKIDSSCLFVGLGLIHPAGGRNTPPESGKPPVVSLLGFAANDGQNPNEFVGNYFLQDQYNEKLSILDEVLEEILIRFKANRGIPPSRVVFYRCGTSEGRFQDILRLEAPVILVIVKRHAPDAPVSIIIPSKLHSIRLFQPNINPCDRSSHQNVSPGTVIDTNLVHHKYCEFYLNSHVALQGTAKTPKYTVLFTNDKNATMDMFERWTNALCYNFQIVTSATSVPAPVYIAIRYAERGSQIYNCTAVSQKNPLLNDEDGEKKAIFDLNKSKLYLKSLQFNFTLKEKLRGKVVESEFDNRLPTSLVNFGVRIF